MQAILEQNKIAESVVNRTDKVFGKKIGFLAALFGCRHAEMSRPFTIGNDSYRACLDCGARRAFDAGTLQTYGSFHFPPALSLDKN